MDLVVWQKAHEFVLAMYTFTKNFPKDELYGLASQFRRAAVSIPANIAEGFKKASIKEKTLFLKYSQSSLEECRYYLILSSDLGYGDCTNLSNMLEEISKLLHGYSKAINK